MVGKYALELTILVPSRSIFGSSRFELKPHLASAVVNRRSARQNQTGRSDPMTQQVFERNAEELLTAIEACLRSRLLLPGLLLLYAGIDIMAWLNRPKSHADVQRSDFVEWAEKYLLPGTKLACSAIDLYAARCSLLHSYTAESRLSREGKAKQVFIPGVQAVPKISKS